MMAHKLDIMTHYHL